jgi:hypothetical protein
MTAPGARLRALAARVCEPETMERIVDPVTADVRTEYADARRCGHVWRCRAIRLTAGLILLKALAVYECDRSARHVRSAVVSPAVRPLFVAFVVTLATTALDTLPFLRRTAAHDRAQLVVRVAYLLPQAAAISMPVGLACGVLGLLKSGAASRRLKEGVLILASVASVAAFVNIAWVVPASNQAYRVSIGGPQVAKGANELTLRELRPLMRPGATIPAGILMPQGRRQLASFYYARWAMAFAPLALSLFALSLERRRQMWASTAMTTMCLTYVGYYLVDPAFSAHLSPIAFGWTPNLVAVLAAITLQLGPSTPRRSTRARVGSHPMAESDRRPPSRR